MPYYDMRLELEGHEEQDLGRRKARTWKKALQDEATERDLTLLDASTRYAKVETATGETGRLVAYTNGRDDARSYYGRGDDEHLAKLGLSTREGRRS
jgi:hypothetical protein